VTASPLGNPYLFRGQSWESVAGLYQDPGRGGVSPLYDPRSGRYTSRAPAGAAGGSAYTFAGDNPGLAVVPATAPG